MLPEGCWRSQPERGESSCKIIQLMKRLGCAKSLWSRRNIAAELPSTSVGLGFCKLPKPHRACGMLCCSSGLPKTGGGMGMCVGRPSAGQKWSHPSLCSEGPGSFWGNAVPQSKRHLCKKAVKLCLGSPF